MNHLLGIVSDPISPNRRGANGTGGLANDPYFQMLQGRGGLGAIFGGGTGQVGDYVTSQEGKKGNHFSFPSHSPFGCRRIPAGCLG